MCGARAWHVCAAGERGEEALSASAASAGRLKGQAEGGAAVVDDDAAVAVGCEEERAQRAHSTACAAGGIDAQNSRVVAEASAVRHHDAHRRRARQAAHVRRYDEVGGVPAAVVEPWVEDDPAATFRLAVIHKVCAADRVL